MTHAKQYQRIVIDRFHFTGYHGCRSCCALEVLRLSDGRTVVIATELADNPGTSVTNAFEIVATEACRRFAIDPARLAWVEHYGYASAFEAGNPRPYDLVEFELMPLGSRYLVGSPSWRRMHEDDWFAQGLTPRPPVNYPRR